MTLERFLLEIPDGDAPLFVRIARAIADDVRRGRLRPGDALPGSRTLAKTLDVHRNTVLAALRELETEGWIETTRAHATRIRRELPEVSPRHFTFDRRASAKADPTDAIGFDLAPRAQDPPAYHTSADYAPGSILLLGGLPDLRLVPSAELARAYRRLVTGPRAAEVFGYGYSRGEEPLRRALAAMLSRTRSLAVTADDVVVTRGSQMALYLAARAVIRPGDRVAVERLGYRPAWEALRAAGAELVPVRVDAGGIVVDDLVEIARAERRLRAVYVTPHHQYPTTALLRPARRIALLELARAHRLAVFEDDYDHEFHYEGRPVTPLASADRTGQVIYIGTLSKILAPSFRVGFVVAPAQLLQRIADIRLFVDRQGDRIGERALAELAEDGVIERHARKMRRCYASRREALVEALEAHLGTVLTFEVPKGGMALWARAPGVDVDAWAEACAARGVVFQTATRFTFEGLGSSSASGRAERAVRLGFAAEPEARLKTAVRRMEEALQSMQGHRGPTAAVKQRGLRSAVG